MTLLGQILNFTHGIRPLGKNGTGLSNPIWMFVVIYIIINDVHTQNTRRMGWKYISFKYDVDTHIPLVHIVTSKTEYA